MGREPLKTRTRAHLSDGTAPKARTKKTKINNQSELDAPRVGRSIDRSINAFLLLPCSQPYDRDKPSDPRSRPWAAESSRRTNERTNERTNDLEGWPSSRLSRSLLLVVCFGVASFCSSCVTCVSVWLSMGSHCPHPKQFIPIDARRCVWVESFEPSSANRWWPPQGYSVVLRFFLFATHALLSHFRILRRQQHHQQQQQHPWLAQAAAGRGVAGWLRRGSCCSEPSGGAGLVLRGARKRRRTIISFDGQQPHGRGAWYARADTQQQQQQQQQGAAAQPLLWIWGGIHLLPLAGVEGVSGQGLVAVGWRWGMEWKDAAPFVWCWDTRAPAASSSTQQQPAAAASSSMDHKRMVMRDIWVPVTLASSCGGGSRTFLSSSSSSSSSRSSSSTCLPFFLLLTDPASSIALQYNPQQQPSQARTNHGVCGGG